jgi:hypothetical protein
MKNKTSSHKGFTESKFHELLSYHFLDAMQSAKKDVTARCPTFFWGALEISRFANTSCTRHTRAQAADVENACSACVNLLFFRSR